MHAVSTNFDWIDPIKCRKFCLDVAFYASEPVSYFHVPWSIVKNNTFSEKKEMIPLTQVQLTAASNWPKWHWETWLVHYGTDRDLPINTSHWAFFPDGFVKVMGTLTVRPALFWNVLIISHPFLLKNAPPYKGLKLSLYAHQAIGILLFTL